MDTKNQPLPFEEEEAIEGATTEFLQNQFKKMSPQMAALWARAIMKSEGSESEMAPQLAEEIQKERDRVQGVTDPLEVERLQASYAKALEENDVLAALDLHEEAESLGIDLRDIEKTIPTSIDLKAISEDEIPSSALS